MHIEQPLDLFEICNRRILLCFDVSNKSGDVLLLFRKIYKATTVSTWKNKQTNKLTKLSNTLIINGWHTIFVCMAQHQHCWNAEQANNNIKGVWQ